MRARVSDARLCVCVSLTMVVVQAGNVCAFPLAIPSEVFPLVLTLRKNVLLTIALETYVGFWASEGSAGPRHAPLVPAPSGIRVGAAEAARGA